MVVMLTGMGVATLPAMFTVGIVRFVSQVRVSQLLLPGPSISTGESATRTVDETHCNCNESQIRGPVLYESPTMRLERVGACSALIPVLTSKPEEPDASARAFEAGAIDPGSERKRSRPGSRPSRNRALLPRGPRRGDRGRSGVTASVSGATRVQPSESAGGRRPDEGARDGPTRVAPSGDAANAFALPIGRAIGD